MNILFRRGRATAAEVLDDLGEPISNSAVRGMLRLLAGKGYIAHEQDGPRYVYFPRHRPADARRSALRNLVDTFFRSSPSSAMAALLDMNGESLSTEEYERLAELLEQARAGRRRK